MKKTKPNFIRAMIQRLRMPVIDAPAPPRFVSLGVDRAPMEGAAQQGAPRSSNPGPNGHMADTIKLRKLPRTTDANLEAHLWLGPDSDHFYGLFGEFGTVHQTATPFMRPAFDQHVQETVTILGKELWAGIERAAKKYNRRRS